MFTRYLLKSILNFTIHVETDFVYETIRSTATEYGLHLAKHCLDGVAFWEVADVEDAYHVQLL